jgi:hypothetical protein
MRSAYLRTQLAFRITTDRNLVHLNQLIKNILTAKHRAAWRPISLLGHSLFRPLDQSQAL